MFSTATITNSNKNNSANKKAKTAAGTNEATTTTTTVGAAAEPTAAAAAVDGFEQVRQYLLQCPLGADSQEHQQAIQAALQGLDQEVKRRERDAKLRLKFGGGSTSQAQPSQQPQSRTSTVPTATAPQQQQGTTNARRTASTQSARGSNKVNNNSNNKTRDELEDEELVNMCCDDEDDWHELNAENDDVSAAALSTHSSTTASGTSNVLVTDSAAAAGDTAASAVSFLGKQLAKEAVTTMSEQGATVQTPVGALALALHAALRSRLLRFACTGVPPQPEEASGGFAPPVRELPATQFLPLDWEQSQNQQERQIQLLRYRKPGLGSIILQVQMQPQQSVETTSTTTTTSQPREVQVALYPEKNKEPVHGVLTFSITDHVNLESFQTALDRDGKVVQPALHYKALSTLLSKFASTFDLGTVHDKEDVNNKEEDDNGTSTTTAKDTPLPYMDATVLQLPTRQQQQQQPQPTFVQAPDPLRIPSRQPLNPWEDEYGHPSLARAFPGLVRDHNVHHGDFGADLYPFGGGGSMTGTDPSRMGNLMGPNHPLFLQRGSVLMIGGGGMRPRYDPIHGGPADLNDIPGNPPAPPLPPGQRRLLPGEPNPDHERPPNTLNSNMFM